MVAISFTMAIFLFGFLHVVIPLEIIPRLETKTDYYAGGHILANVVYLSKNTIADCYLVGDINYVRFLLNEDSDKIPGPLKKVSIPTGFIRTVENLTVDDMGKVVDECTRLGENGTHSVSLGKFTSFFTDIFKQMFIFPGTKWCGAGNVAKNYDDLGKLDETDKCCRRHDQSEDSISAGETKHNLTNELLYTMTRCPWDEQFSSCLSKSNNVPSAVVGNMFFNLLKTRCFDLRKPAVCAKKQLLLIGPCKEYIVDESKPEEWHIFDPKKFTTNLIAGDQLLDTLLYSAPGFNDLTDLKKSPRMKSYTDYYDGGHVIANVIENDQSGIIDCFLIGDIYTVRQALNVDLDLIPAPIQTETLPADLINDLGNITKDEMIKIIDKCSELTNKGIHGVSLSDFISFGSRLIRHLFVFPGTKWCGNGAVAKSFDDLGPLEATDKCCRRHDQSSDFLEAGETKFGLTNPLLYTMTRCQWDLEFNKCLESNRDLGSAIVGNMFFNILRTKCFDFDYPAPCSKKLGVSCIEYTKDTTKKPVWQIFDPTPFRSNLFPGASLTEAIISAVPGFNEVNDVLNTIKQYINI